MNESNSTGDDNIGEAERLYRQGLLIYRGIRTPDGLAKVAIFWQQALDLSRQSGDEVRVQYLEKCLARLTQKVLTPVARLESEEEGGGIPIHKKVRAVRSYKDWWVFLKVGCFGFGGPMAVLGLLENELVERKKVLSHKDFLEAAVIGDSLPGPVTMDIVTYAGYKLRGWRGAAISTFIFILPSFLLMLLIATYYDKFNSIALIKNVLHCLGAAVCAIIVSVGLALGQREIKNNFEAAILVWAFMSSLIFKIDMAIIVVLAGFAGMLWSVVRMPA